MYIFLQCCYSIQVELLLLIDVNIVEVRDSIEFSGARADISCTMFPLPTQETQDTNVLNVETSDDNRSRKRRLIKSIKLGIRQS